jgi:hypothetical protein
MAAGFNNTISLYDTRTKSQDEVALDSKVYCVDYFGGSTIGAANSDSIKLIDLRNPKQAVQSIEMNTKMPPNCLKFHGNGYYVAGYEGKISYEDHIDSSKAYSFKCHRDEHEIIYPINSIEMHPQ